MLTLAFIEGLLSPMHWIIILVVALLLFGSRLPDVARSMGKSVVEFKKGLKGVEDDAEDAASKPSGRPSELPRSDAAYRAPLGAAGEDRRVSRADVEQSSQQ
ncbi:MAG: twin-arginine translocase TatA/TatE family subunit [Planctomycetota bacterium]